MSSTKVVKAKTRTARLMQGLEDLQAMGCEASSRTTLRLLTQARTVIKALKEKDRKTSILLKRVKREERRLQREVDALTGSGHYGSLVQLERNIRECRTSTNASFFLSPRCSEHPDEADINGGGNGNSDELICGESGELQGREAQGCSTSCSSSRSVDC